MATHHLGPQLDIHGGGADLVFPHHACEIAQAEPVTGVTPFAKVWMHVGLVMMGGTKMSKSLGNMVFVDQILAENSANALRLAILEQPYHAEYEYAREHIEEGERDAGAIIQALAAQGGRERALESREARAEFTDALEENFNTPAAIRVAVRLAEAISERATTGADVSEAQATLREMSRTLGLVEARL
jgi:L-cysteine:1D-myo-inositol 2-amino-2-deoxy-alpha-D-glucopyranoside ligase